MPDKPETTGEQPLTAEQRIAAELATVTDWDSFDSDKFYDARFPHEVDRHTFRRHCRRAVAEAKNSHAAKIAKT